MDKAYDVLNPAGILMVIVPLSFMQSEFWEKTRVANINKDFFLFQYLRPLVVIAASCHAPLQIKKSRIKSYIIGKNRNSGRPLSFGGHLFRTAVLNSLWRSGHIRCRLPGHPTKPITNLKLVCV